MALKGRHKYRHDIRHEAKLTRRLIVNRWRYFTKPKLTRKIQQIAANIARAINKLKP